MLVQIVINLLSNSISDFYLEIPFLYISHTKNYDNLTNRYRFQLAELRKIRWEIKCMNENIHTQEVEKFIYSMKEKKTMTGT